MKYYSGTRERAINTREVRLQVKFKGTNLSTNSHLRTDVSLRARFDETPHKGYSILEELLIDMILDFSLDPMHLAGEGACRKTCMTILEDPEFKRTPYHVKRVNEHMDLLSKCTLQNF